MQEWYLYLIRCRDGSLYTGITTDVERRFAEHRNGNGSKYVRCRRPVTLELQKKVGSRNFALMVEHRIKQLPKAQKEKLIRDDSRIDDIISSYLDKDK
jgi:putative endonuclease